MEKLEYKEFIDISRNYFDLLFNRLAKLHDKMFRYVVSLDIDENDKKIILKRFLSSSANYLNDCEKSVDEIIKKYSEGEYT